MMMIQILRQTLSGLRQTKTVNRGGERDPALTST